MEKKEEIITEENNMENRPHYVKFSQVYKHDGKEYKGLDMDCMYTITTKQKIEIDRLYEFTEKVKSRNPIATTMYAVCAAHYITKLPIEFFYSLRVCDFIKIETEAKQAFFGLDLPRMMAGSGEK